MLPPHERSVLLEALRPPSGYRLDQAIGTTFTLDLLALLTAPLAFTYFDWEDDEGRPTADPLALLEALRRHAERIHLFCHAGQIAVPPRNQKLLAYLENSVIEVLPPEKGALFHPKVWVLRFTGEGEPVRYRLLVSSRNLTFDRAWDTLLVLDGVLTDRRNAFSRNHPLGEFLKLLPTMAVHPPRPEVLQAVKQMEREMRRVDFELPEHVEEVAFVPLGIPGYGGLPFPSSGRRMLVASPFLSDGFLGELAPRVKLSHVVSRPETFEKIDPTLLKPFEEGLWVMSPDGELDVREGAEEAADARNELTGLHAKLFLMDDGWDARAWMGSANASRGAFHGNVELLVELRGKKSRLGIDAFLGDEDDRDAFGGLLQPCPLHEEVEIDQEEELLDRKLEQLRADLARRGLQAAVEKGHGEVAFELVVRAPEPAEIGWPEDVAVSLRPATLGAGHDHTLEPAREAVHRFPASFDALTSFFVFTVRLPSGDGRGAPVERALVLNLPLKGAPADRRERLLQALLENDRQVLRLLLLLLSDEELRVAEFIETAAGGAAEFEPFGSLRTGTLLESLLHALQGSPANLEHAARVIEDLEKTKEGRALLPDGLDEIWKPVLAVHRERQKRRGRR